MFLFAVTGLILATSSGESRVHADAKNPTFVDDVTPVLKQHCMNCHGNEKQKGGLNLATYASMQQGGSAGVVVTPGNDGIAAHGFACVATPATQLDGDLFVIGPEQPLVEGLADELRAQGKTVVGPGADGARLEGSKAYMKEFLAAAGVATAAYGTFRDPDAALAFLRTMRPPYVVKTDGLAAGKGVLVTDDFERARADVRDKLSGAAFGEAGTTIVIEEGLAGQECSLLFLCCGDSAVALAPAQDFKRVGDGDRGANTGGMGAFAPLGSMRGVGRDRGPDAARVARARHRFSRRALRRRDVDR